MTEETPVVCPTCSSDKVQKDLTNFSLGTKENKISELEKRLQQQHDEIKNDLKEYKKELREKDWRK